MSARRKPGSPGLFFGIAAWLLLGLLAACSPRLDWRQVRSVELGFEAALPEKPQTVTREVDYTGPGGPLRLPMTMVSTGVGPSLFAVGVVRLPAAALASSELEATVSWFRDALVRNLGGVLLEVAPTPQPAPAGRQVRGAWTVRAKANAGRNGRAGTLAARFVVADDRLYQVVALGADTELTPAVIETFFESFRLIY